MEYVFNSLKSFILENLNDYLELVTDDDTPMPMVSENNIVFGSVDLSRLSGKVICSILPDSQEDDEEELASRNILNNLVVTFIFSDAKYEVLVRQMARYASAFRKALLDNPTLNNTVEYTEVKERTFFTDAGITDKQKTAVEVNLTITVEEEINE